MFSVRWHAVEMAASANRWSRQCPRGAHRARSSGRGAQQGPRPGPARPGVPQQGPRPDLARPGCPMGQRHAGAAVKLRSADVAPHTRTTAARSRHGPDLPCGAGSVGPPGRAQPRSHHELPPASKASQCVYSFSQEMEPQHFPSGWGRLQSEPLSVLPTRSRPQADSARRPKRRWAGAGCFPGELRS